MRDIMVGVTLSPYKSADLLIVLYRNLVMVVRIVKVYRVRPALSEQLRIFSDIINVIATVNYINMGKNLIEGLASRVPGIGRFMDDIAQGIGAGFMTTITGHAAMDRCRSFRGWNETDAKRHLLSHVGDFYNDVKDIFFKDVWGGIRGRASATIPDAGEKISDAIDATGSLLAVSSRSPSKPPAPPDKPLSIPQPASPLSEKQSKKPARFLPNRLRRKNKGCFINDEQHLLLRMSGSSMAVFHPQNALIWKKLQGIFL